jgi:hypothetical protein
MILDLYALNFDSDPYGGCGPCRNGRYGGGLSYPFPYNTRCSRARGFTRRTSDGANYIWTVSDCYAHNGFPKAWYTGRRPRRQRTHVVVITRFVVSALTCRVRFSRSRRVRTFNNHNLAMLPPQRPTVARAGCVAEARSNNEQIARSLDGLPSLVLLSAFATDIFPKLQADIIERVNLLRFAKLAPTFSNRARHEFRRLYLVSATPPLRFWLRIRLLRVAWASSVTSSLSTTT